MYTTHEPCIMCSYVIRHHQIPHIIYGLSVDFVGGNTSNLAVFPTVNAWCNNKNQPYLTDLIRAAEVLEVAPADLIVDGTKKGKGQSKTLTLTEFS